MKKHLLTLAMALLCTAAAWGMSVPYTQSFDTKADFETMTLLNAGEDSRNWDWSSSAARFYPGSRYKSYSAWFFTPSLDLEAGKTYVITFSAKISSSGSSNYKDLYVTYGSDCTVATQSQAWKESIQSTSYADKKCTITPQSTGAYNIGFHTEASSGSMNDLLVDNIVIKEYVSLPGKATGITAIPGEKGVLSVTLSWINPSLNDGGSALTQLSGVKIYRTDSSWVEMGESNLVATVTDGIAIGQPSTWTDNTIDKAGTYYYIIVPFNDNGASPLTADKIKTAYVGADTGIGATKNVVATAVEGNDKAVTLTWDTPVGGNGGYIDPGNVAWKISRKGNTGESVVLEESWTATVPYLYTDASIPALDAYTYTVQYVYNGLTESNGATSNVIVTGGTAELPFSDGFDSFSPVYTQIVTEGNNWNHSSWSGYIYYTSKSGASDAWLVTPPFELKKGVTYEIGYQAWKSGSYAKNLILTAGSAPTAEALTTEIANDEITATSGSNDASRFIVRYTAVSDGPAYWGFHVSTTATSGNLYLDNISIKEVKVVPQAVTDLTATPDPDDRLEVKLSWVNPTADNLGNPLSTIDKIEVYRDNLMIKKYTEALPGDTISLTDDGIETAGNYTYRVVAYLGQNAGEAATVASGLVGGAIALPYIADFSSAECFESWTMPTNASGDKWSYNASTSRLEAPDKNDLWLFTPQFKAAKGVVTLKLTGAARSSSFKENVKIALYRQASSSAEAVATPIDHQFVSTTPTEAQFTFDVPEGGKYYIGIYRPTTAWNLYLTGASIEQTKVINDNAPLPVSGLTVVPDAENDKLVNLSWTNPTLTVGGAQLESITKIEVLRGGELVVALSGDATTYADIIGQPGKYTYSVIAYNGVDASEPTTVATGFIGGAYDLPYSADFDDASTFEVWNFIPNSDGRTLNYIGSKKYLETYSDNVAAESPMFNVRHGQMSVTLSAKTSSYRYPTKLNLAVMSKDKEMVANQDYEFTNSSWSETQTLDAKIPADGKYYVLVTVTDAGNGTTIDAFAVEQSLVIEPISIYWDNTEAQYEVPSVSIDGADAVAMTCLQDEPSRVAALQRSPRLLSRDIYYIEIPGDVQAVKFLDANNAGSGVEVQSPRHNYIYKLDGTGTEFTPDDVTAIEGVVTDSFSTPVYFTLQGLRVDTPVAGNIYIVIRSGKVTKELIK